MGKLRIVELVGEDFEPRRQYIGFNSFYEEVMLVGKGEVNYYSFNPPENFLTKLSLEENFSEGDIYNSKIFNEFSWYAYNLIKNKYPFDSTNEENFSERYKLIRNELSFNEEESKGIGDEKLQKMGIKRIKQLPFFSDFWGKFMTFESRFLKSNFNVKYFDQIKKEIDYYREEFGENFKRQEYNQYLFENVYELFSEISLGDLISKK